MNLNSRSIAIDQSQTLALAGFGCFTHQSCLSKINRQHAHQQQLCKNTLTVKLGPYRQRAGSMFGFLDQSLRASEQMVSRTKEVAFMVPFVMVNSTYYVSGALTGVTVGVVTTAADVIGTLLWDSDSIKLEIELTAEDLRSIASDAGLDFTLCPSPASQPQTPQLSHANSKADLLEEEPSSLKMKSYDVLQQELHSSKQALISAQGSLAEAEQKAMQVRGGCTGLFLVQILLLA